MKIKRYDAVMSRIEPTSWNVIDRAQVNDDGEPFILIPLTTHEHAVAEAAKLNAADTAKPTDKSLETLGVL